jgi:putative MATE family efflux protein
MLAWPVLAQQFLHLFVKLSDRFLAGYFPQVPLEQQVEAAGQQLLAVGSPAVTAPGSGLASVLAAQAPALTAQHIMARQIAYQSAQTTAGYLAWVIISYTVLVSVGSTALVSRFVGAGDWQKAVHVTNQSIVLAVFLGAIGTVAGLAGLSQLMALLQLSGEAAVYAADYLRPLFGLLVFQIVEQAGIACLVGAGDTRTGLWVLGGVAIVNVPLAWLFFHGLGPFGGLGFAGIALGTAVSHALGCVAVLLLLGRGQAGLRLHLAQLWPDGELMRRLLRISVPAGIDSLSVAASQLWFLGIVNQLGDVASTAHGIALEWEGLAYLSGGAFGTAAMTLVGQNLGAARPDRAAHSGWVAFALASGVMCVMAVVFFLLAPVMFFVFCPRPEQAPVIAEGVPVLQLVAFAMPALASCIIFTYALRGAGDTRIPVLFTWIGFLGVRIPLAYWLTSSSVGLGLWGAWLAMFADLVVRGAFFLHRFASGRWQSIRV